MAFPVISDSLFYAHEAALLQLESLQMLLQDSASAYTTDKPDSNEYLLEFHVQLVHHITGFLQDQSKSPVALKNISPDTSIFKKSSPADIPTQGPTSVPNSDHMY